MISKKCKVVIHFIRNQFYHLSLAANFILHGYLSSLWHVHPEFFTIFFIFPWLSQQFTQFFNEFNPVFKISNSLELDQIVIFRPLFRKAKTHKNSYLSFNMALWEGIHLHFLAVILFDKLQFIDYLEYLDKLIGSNFLQVNKILII